MEGKKKARKIITSKKTESGSSTQQNPKVPKRPEPNTTPSQKSLSEGIEKWDLEG
jgi:hypothetical protein